ncbi:hypothetical protein V6N13_029209 [Hibiscus sabdariffa]
MSMKLFVWNTQECGSRNFIRVTKEYIRDAKPDVCVFVETRVSQHRADQVTILSCHFQFVHCRISFTNTTDCFYATFIYASPTRRLRQHLWQHLIALSSSISSPWVVLGDFNATLSHADRQGCSSASPEHSFQDMVSICGLHDLGYCGPHYTWTCGRRSVRLDRGFGNSRWFEHFPNHLLHHLIRMKSNHRPILLSTDDQVYSPRPHNFKYFAGWFIPITCYQFF